jgi:hypothetical protein
VDETEYRERYRALNRLPCVFEKALLTRCADCSRAHRFNLAEREGAACLSPAAQARCSEWLALLRPSAKFALRLTQVEGPLPHAKELKVQCGGLRGLDSLVSSAPPAEARVADIASLLDASATRYGALGRVPLQEIVKSVSAYEARRRRPRG